MADSKVVEEIAARTRFGPIFAVVAAGWLMCNLDLFIVNVALPQIGRHFAGSLSALSWLLNGYAVVFAALLVPAGALADRIGARRAYIAGLGVFTAASVLCAVCPSVGSLVAARVVQAAGAAILTPASLGLLLASAPPGRSAAAVRGWTAVAGIGASLGPLLGGLLTQFDWRWVFLVNLPVGLVTIAAGAKILPHTSGRREAVRPDLVGAAVLILGVAALALGVVKGEEWGWNSAKVIGSLVAAVVLLGVFVLLSARHPAPVLPLGLFRIRAFGVSSVGLLLFSIAFASMLLSVILWCQDVWHWSAVRTGLAISPGPLMLPGLSIGAAPLARRFGPGRLACAGCVAFASGIAWWMWRMADGYGSGMLPGLLLIGLGVGLTLPTMMAVAASCVPPAKFSTGSAAVTMLRQVGTVLGIAILVAVLGAGRGGSANHDEGWLVAAVTSVAAAGVCLYVPRPRQAAGIVGG